MVDAYKDRLREAMKEAGVTVATLAKELKITPQAVKKVLDGKSAALSAPNNAKAAKFLGRTSDWLALGVDSDSLQLTPQERAMIMAARQHLRAPADELAAARGEAAPPQRLVSPSRASRPQQKKKGRP